MVDVFRLRLFRAMSAISAMTQAAPRKTGVLDKPVVAWRVEIRGASTCHRERAANRGPRQARFSLAGVA